MVKVIQRLGILSVRASLFIFAPDTYNTAKDNHSHMSIEQLQPANPQEVRVYLPYFQGNKRNTLPLAISLYKQGVLQGQRNIEGGDGIPFIATWNVSTLPADLTRCRMQFDGKADLSYEVMMSSSELVDFLIDTILQFKRNSTIDFSKGFYRKLLRFDD